MGVGHGDSGHDIGVAATRFHRAMRETVSTALQPFSLSGAEYGALDYVSRHDRPSNSDLARYLLVSPQALGRLTSRLEVLGLVDREAAARGHRYSLRLTTDGRSTLAAARPHVEAAQQHLLAPLDEDERIRFAHALIACTDHHDHLRDGPA